MNGNEAMPTLTFSDECDYEMLDHILNGGAGNRWGWGVRIWFAQGVIVTARWGGSSWDDTISDSFTSLLAWDEGSQDYTNEIRVRTDDITRLEIL